MSGRYLPLSPARVFVADLSDAAQRLPQGVIGRRIDVSALVAARRRGGKQVPVPAYFVKAMAECARDMPEFRRSYVGFLRPRLYEHAVSVCSLIIERVLDGETVIFPARIKRPAERSLSEVAEDIAEAVSTPVDQIARTREILLVSRLPRPIRRFIWRLAFNLPRYRQHYVGTFGVTAIGHLGSSILYPLSPVSVSLAYGPIAPDETVDVTLGFDHRVLDGAVAARGLSLLEAKLKRIADAA
jgi:pyruvate/2-oxoglutarate dehydrogenase complex dihydrolipoamide acyltransferase (E2) component